jgi:hypothetical protein
MDFVSEEASINLFIIGDVERFGMVNPIQTLWGLYDEMEGQLKGVMLRFRRYYTLYAKDSSIDLDELLEIVKEDPAASSVAGKASVLEKLNQIFIEEICKKEYFCELKNDELLLEYDLEVKKAVPEDGERIFNLLETIEEFNLTDTESVENISENLRTGLGRTYYLEGETGEIISMAQTTAENSQSAMVVGVATHPDYRKRGLMSRCLSNLCRELIEEEKILCLFYDNPKAGAVYHRLGFQTIDQWMMRLNKRSIHD